MEFIVSQQAGHDQRMAHLEIESAKLTKEVQVIREP